MTRDEALARIRPHERELREAGLAALYLFGSTARNEAGADSDVDLAFELGTVASFGMIRYFAMCDRVAEFLGRPIDLVELKAMRAPMRQRVDTDLVKVF